MTAESNSVGAERSVRVFLSYARADRARAAKLANALQKSGLTVWWDTMIEGGEAFADSIGQALAAADAVIVLWSRASVASDWVRDEAAQGRDRKRLVPVSLDGSEPPLGFRQYHAIDLSGWRGRHDAAQIAAILRAVAAACDVPLPPPHAEPRRSLTVSRRGVLVMATGAAGVLGVGAYGGWRSGLFGSGIVADSIAILPFRDLSGDAAQTYFSEGLTEEFRAVLSRNDALKVMAGTSSEAARAEDADLLSIARRLAVAFVLDGTVRRAGDMVRISANLTDGRTGFSRWSQSFDRKLADIFAVQTEIAGVVADELAVRIATDAPTPGGTTIVPAYEAYLRGRSLFNAAKDEASDRAALANYDLAIAADGNFALAHAARSRSLAAIAAEYADADQLRPLYDAAIAAADRAVAIAPDLAEAQLALGYATFIGRFDIAGARPAYDKAHALGHGDADILLLFALYVVRARRGADALAAIKQALALDPLNPRTHRAAGSINYALRRYPAAIAHLKQAIALNPKISNAHALIGNCLYQGGRFDDARAAYAAEPNEMFRLSGLAMAHHRRGDADAARAAMAALIAGPGDSALYQQAEVLAQWGQIDAAVRTLARAREVGDSGILYLVTDPMLDPIADQPGFHAVARSLGLR